VARIGQQVSSALSYAHGQRVLHRDIKPSNLLLDACGTVWVTDFGLAKEEGNDLTRTGDVVGTLRYIAPERFTGVSDARSDIYSLGLTLYELLTLRAAFAETDRVRLVRTITHEEPLVPHKIDPHIPRDLETIVLKAIAKESTRRYARAEDLEEDLSRFLLDRPIAARRASGWERTWRWCRRNPLAASLATSLSVILIGGIVGLTALYMRADTQRRRAEGAEASWRAAADDARTRETQARQSASDMKAVLKFFQDRVLSAARPKGLFNGLGKDATIRAALDQASSDLEKSFKDQPLVEASIRDVLGATYFYLDEVPRATVHHRRALSLRRGRLAEDDPAVLESRYSLAWDEYSSGHLDVAEKMFRELLGLQKRRLGPDAYQTLTTMDRLARTLDNEDRLAEAIPLCEEAYQRARKALGPEDADTIFHLSHLGSVYQRAARWAEAVPLLEEGVRLHTAKLGPEHNDTIVAMNNLAHAYNDLGRSAEALKLWEKALTSMRAAVGPDHLSTLTLMNNVAMVHRDDGKPNEAIPMLEDVVRRMKANRGPDHPNTLLYAGNLAIAYRDAGRLDQALGLFDETLKTAKTKLGPGHQTCLNLMNQTTDCLLKMKRLAEAEALANDCLTLRMKKNPQDWWVFQTKSQLGQAKTRLAKYPEAEPLLLEGQKELASRKDRIPARFRPYIAVAGDSLVDLYDHWGKKTEAAAWRQKLAGSSSR
jgi:tetratricopeptide (TPR) repeat protein